LAGGPHIGGCAGAGIVAILVGWAVNSCRIPEISEVSCSCHLLFKGIMIPVPQEYFSGFLYYEWGLCRKICRI
jgi:hypothetical protein